MSTVAEIEAAIEELSPEEVLQVSSWLQPKVDQLEERRRILQSLAGSLTEDDDDFVQAVFEAGQDPELLDET